MDDPAEHVASADRSGPGFLVHCCGLRRFEFEATVRTSSVVVADVLGEDCLEVTSAEDQEMVETVFTDRSHPVGAENPVRPAQATIRYS